MKLILLVSLVLAGNALGWFTNTNPYDKWDDNTLTAWLKDHNIIHSTAPAKSTVQEAWEKVSLQSPPYESWDDATLRKWLQEKRVEIDDSLPSYQLKDRVYENWYSLYDTWGSAKDWVYDSWTDSQLKAFGDRHGITTPTPRSKAVQALQSAHDGLVKEKGHASGWVYDTWSDSELKKWADERGIPVPQGSKRNELLSTVRRNAYTASLKSQRAIASFEEGIFDSYSDSKLKKLLDERGVNVPQGSKRNELLALVRRNSYTLQHDISSLQARASKTGNKAFGSATSALGAATSAVAKKWYEAEEVAFDAWSDTRLKAFLDARGVPVPQHGTKDDLLSLARLYKTKAQQKTVGGPTTFDQLSSDQLTAWLQAQGHKISHKEEKNRQALLSAAQKQYASVSASGGDAYASVTSALAKQTGYLFDSWSDSDLKAFLDSYGIPVPQGSKRNELIAAARRNSRWFLHGNDFYGAGLLAHVQKVFWENVEFVKGKVVNTGKIVDDGAHKAFTTVSAGATDKVAAAAATVSKKAKNEL